MNSIGVITHYRNEPSFRYGFSSRSSNVGIASAAGAPDHQMALRYHQQVVSEQQVNAGNVVGRSMPAIPVRRCCHVGSFGDVINIAVTG